MGRDGGMPPPAASECDVLVVGSGAGGLSVAVTAAFHGLNVIVVEKEPVIGGTTAWSGGWMWIPRNPLARDAGIIELPEAPRRYLQSEIGAHAGDRRIAVFLANAPEMVAFFRSETRVAFVDGNAVPDFHASPGSADGGRSVCAAPFDGRLLGAWIGKLRPPLDVVSLWGMGIAAGSDLAHFMNATRSLASATHVAGRLLRHGRDLLLQGRGMQLVNGNALAAGLLRSALDLGVGIETETPAVRLLWEDRRVVGAVVPRDGGERHVRARLGVVLAAGGYPHDRDRIAETYAHARGGVDHFSAAPGSNTGDGLRLGESVGGVVDANIASPAAWSPVSLVPLGGDRIGRFPHLIGRAKPGIIIVDRHGHRFVNEAESYHDVGAALLANTPAGEAPVAWLVCDHAAQRRYGLGWARPFPFPLGGAVRSGYLKKGGTIGDLARACGIDAAALERTVAAFNQDASRGVDPRFGRGLSSYNRVQGDRGHVPNPALGPLARAPFYAVRLLLGDLGTFAGLVTDARGRVLDRAGAAIDGLFAVGNDMASIMAGHYPSGGITLGPAMTFGYVVGRTLAGQTIAEP